jgi:hypothetical protein
MKWNDFPTTVSSETGLDLFYTCGDITAAVASQSERIFQTVFLSTSKYQTTKRSDWPALGSKSSWDVISVSLRIQVQIPPVKGSFSPIITQLEKGIKLVSFFHINPPEKTNKTLSKWWHLRFKNVCCYRVLTITSFCLMSGEKTVPILNW